MPWVEWYNSLAKPSWTPAPATIGLIWQILYPVILVSFGFVFVQAFRGKVGWMIASIYLICGAFRLARFNCMARMEQGSSREFLGFPIPAAAGLWFATIGAKPTRPPASKPR